MIQKRVVLLVLAFFSAVRPASASWHQEFTTTTTNNAYVVAEHDSLHFKCDGSQSDGTHATASLSPIPANGASATFYIAVRVASGVSVKLQLFEDVALHWKRGRATWVIYDSERIKYIALGASNITPGSGMHTVTYVRGTDKYLVFEDGILVASHESPRTVVTPAFKVTLRKRGDKVDLTLSNIQIHYGLAAQSTVLTT